MSFGILAGIADPDFRAKLAERRRIEERVAEQMGITVSEARKALYEFEAKTSHDGYELH